MYNLEFIRLFNPHLNNINNIYLKRLLYNITPEQKKNYNLILDINDFKRRYPKIDLYYYIIHNDDLLTAVNNEMSVYLHYINHGINESRITDYDSFKEKYDKYDYIFFKNVNQNFIDKFLLDRKETINIYTKFGIDINSKKFEEIYISKIYSQEYEINIKENNRNMDVVLSLNDFNFKYPNIRIELIALFNEEYFPDFSKKRILKEDSSDIIKFYFENKHKNQNQLNLIFTIDDFFKKYPHFDIDIFKTFNKQINKNDIMCYLSYHNNYNKEDFLIGSIEDFYNKYPNFNLENFRNFNLEYENKEELICIFDYSRLIGTENNLICNIEEFYTKYPKFELNIFKKFNVIYEDKTELECLYDYHKFINKKIVLISSLEEFHNRYPDFKLNQEDNNITLTDTDTEIKLCLEYLEKNKDLNIKKKIKELDFDYQFYINTYPDLKAKNINNEIKALNHYINHGKQEGRKCNLESFKKFYKIESNVENIEINNKPSEVIYKENPVKYIKNLEEVPENRINILIRTCYRPELFRECIKSILEQDYRNIRVLISYDDKK